MSAAKKASATPAPVSVNIEWLSDCSGCHVAIVDLHEKILNVLAAVKIQRCPVLTDVKDYPKARVGLVSGAIRNVHDRGMDLDPEKLAAGEPAEKSRKKKKG